MSSPAGEYVDFSPTVDAIGNHPAKMATLLLFSEQADISLGKSQLAKAFMEAQGDEPGWVLTRGSRGTPFSYCERGVAPSLLDETEIPSERGSGMVKAYRINQAGLEQGMPLSGAGLGWELAYDSTSLSHILGYSNSNTRTDRMPSLRTKIYEQLLSPSGSGMSRTQLQKAVGETTGRFMQLIPNLRDAGIVVIAERYDPADRNVTLHEPDFMNLRRGGARVHPETHAIFEVAKKLVGEAKTTMTGQDFLDAITIHYPQYEQAAVWNRLTIARAANKMLFVEFAPFEGDGKQHTSMVIAPEYEEPISALVKSIRRLETDPAYRTEARQQAREIIHDPELVADLLYKAHRNSAHANALEDSKWRSFVLKHIPDEGIDTRTLYESVKAVSPPVSYTYFRRLLTEQNGQGYDVEWSGARGRMGRSIGRVSLQRPTL